MARRRKSKLDSYKEAIALASVMNPTPANIVKHAEVNKPGKVCFRCDNAYGHAMQVFAHDTGYIYICPNCGISVEPDRKMKGIRTV